LVGSAGIREQVNSHFTLERDLIVLSQSLVILVPLSLRVLLLGWET